MRDYWDEPDMGWRAVVSGMINLSAALSETSYGLWQSAQQIIDTENQNLANILGISYQISDPGGVAPSMDDS
jgi:hypothetical protein